MKNLPWVVLAILFAFSGSLNAQRYISKNGHVWFYSHTPIEDIEGHNHQVVGVLDATSGEVTIQMLVKSFEFEKALMQEHFNENYMESDKFPKADFKGKITNLSGVNFTKDGTYQVDFSGSMTIHGTTKPFSSKASITVKGGTVTGSTKFKVKPEDFNIQIPKLVEGKIAKEIDVTVEIPFSKG